MSHNVVELCAPGTGSNVCYMEELSNVEKVHVPEDGTDRQTGGKGEEEETEAQAKDVIHFFKGTMCK